MLSSEDAGSAEDYPTLFFILHFDGAHFRDLMPAPTYMRVQGRKCYRLVLTGFVVLIFVSKQSVPGAFLHVVWGPDRPVRGYDAGGRGIRILSSRLGYRRTNDAGRSNLSGWCKSSSQ